MGKTVKMESDRFIISVRVGPKGQVTIPACARKMFGIKEGDNMMVMGDKARGGIALIKADVFYDMFRSMENDFNKN